MIAKFLAIFFLFSCAFARVPPYPPLFEYPHQSLKYVERFNSTYTIEESELKKWDKIIGDYMADKPHVFGDKIRLLAYLYGAQRDFAFLSYSMKGKLMGSLDAVSIFIIRMFYPFFRSHEKLKLDPYSLLLASVVFKKYKHHFEAERLKAENFRSYNLQSWQGINLEYGVEILNWIPWKLPLILTNTATPPSSSEVEWANQLLIVKEELNSLTDEEKTRATFWGNFFAAEWIELINNYLFSKDVALSKALYVRSFIAMAIYDSLIFAFDIKYTYMIKPPYLADPTIKPLIPTIHPYPSYPSAHAMIAEVAALVLTYFFPEDKQKWESLSRQNAESRLWAGVNYPVDIEEGRVLARTVFKEFLLIQLMKE